MSERLLRDHLRIKKSRRRRAGGEEGIPAGEDRRAGENIGHLKTRHRRRKPTKAALKRESALQRGFPTGLSFDSAGDGHGLFHTFTEERVNQNGR